MKHLVNIHSVNLLYLTIDKVIGYIKESNGNKCLLLMIKTKKYWQNIQYY